jgi:hypothetical protein
MLLTDNRHLTECIKARQDLDSDINQLWQICEFRKLLIANLSSKNPVFPPPSPSFPRLWCYRGTGYTLRLKQAVYHASQGLYSLTVTADYVHKDIEPIDELVGCPGAAVETVELHFTVGETLLNKPTKKLFNSWAKIHSAIAREQLKDKVYELAARYGLKVSVS